MSKSRSAIKSAFLQHLLSKSTAPASLVKEFIHQRRENNPESYETSGLSETDSHITDADLLRLLDRLSVSINLKCCSFQAMFRVDCKPAVVFNY